MQNPPRPRVMVDMSATLIHHGHIRLLKKAAEIGDVVVALTSDEEVKRTKGYVPELNFDERKEILESITNVIYDPTIFIKTKTYGDEIRTFCTSSPFINKNLKSYDSIALIMLLPLPIEGI